MSPVVCFLGIDGSGKTTQARRLVDALRARGVRARYAYLRGKGFKVFSVPVLLLGRALGYDMEMGDESAARARRRLRLPAANRPLCAAWTWTTLLDASILMALRRLRSPRSVLVSDRYLHDPIVDLAAGTGDAAVARSFPARLFLTLHRPALVLLLDVPEDVALARKRENTPGYLAQRRALLADVARGAVRLDASGSPDDVARAALDATLRRLAA